MRHPAAIPATPRILRAATPVRPTCGPHAPAGTAAAGGSPRSPTSPASAASPAGQALAVETSRPQARRHGRGSRP
ncbi:hypothetical protein GCM10027575_75310 [Phytohabitans suffuscus]